MKMLTLKSFITKLESDGVNFELVNPLYSLEVRPANFKNIIKNGFYHVSSGYSGDLLGISDSVIISDREIQVNKSNSIIIVENPQLIHYLLCQLFLEKKKPSIHSTALIDKSAKIGQNVNIGPYSIIGNCKIEDGVFIESHVVIHDDVVIKQNSFIDSHCVIGPGGIAWVWGSDGSRVTQPQLGGVIIEEECHLCTDVTIVRGSMSENTRIGKGTVIAHGSKIGHGADVGEFIHMANNVSIAGNTVLGNRSFYGSGCTIPPNIKIPDNCIVGAGALVNKNFEGDFLTLVGVPAKVLRDNSHQVKAKGTPIPFKK